MEQGSLAELYLSRSVTKHIKKHNRNLICGGAVGNDCALFSVEEGKAVATEGWGYNPFIAWSKAMNNMAASGGIPKGVRLLMLLPQEVEEASIKSFMQQFNSMADQENIQIMGGHTQVSFAYKEATFVVTALGRLGDYEPCIKEAAPGCDIVMTKWAGVLGTDLIIENGYDNLRKVLPGTYITGGNFGKDCYRVSKEAGIATSLDKNVCYMHDISTGGVYAGLWQLGQRLGKGMRVDHYKIPIKQETIEFCQIFDINPYMLEGTGSLLIVAKNGETVVKSLFEEGISSAVIGKLTQEKDRIIQLGEDGEKRFLTPGKGDEIYKAVSFF